MSNPANPTDRQSRTVLEAARRGWITPLQIVREHDITRLGARIYDLRQLGWEFEERWQRTPAGARVKAFRLRPPVQQLEQPALFGGSRQRDPEAG